MEEEEEDNLSTEETEEDGKIKYTLPQRVFIFKSYAKSESVEICRQQFREAYPNVPPPKRSRIIRLANNFAATGMLLDVKKIEDRHIKELENEAEENKKRKVVIPNLLESIVVESQNSVSDVGIEDISCMVKAEIKTEPSSPEHDAGSNDLECMHIKKEMKDGVESSSAVACDALSALQAHEWGFVEENPTPNTFPTPDALWPYPCQHCGCCFRTYTDLKSHITKTHVEMVRCKECDKEFPTRTQLQRHEVQHSATPPFICVKCNKGYMSRGKLTSHIKKSHVKHKKSKEQKKKTKKKKK